MNDLRGQYLRLQPEIDRAMQEVLTSTAFIRGPQVKAFADELSHYLSIPYVIPCGNGTDALQMALTGLGLQPGDEVIVPAFTYAAAVEVVALSGMVPVIVDVDPQTYNIDPELIEAAVSPRTKAIIAVHLFGQCCDMETISAMASRHRLYVIEDNAQSVGATCSFSDGTVRHGGTIGHVGATSFFPSKPLACYGDGGAMMTSDPELAELLQKIANHGQKQKYHHEVIGCNSRLDTLQAAILRVKLKYMDAFTLARRQAAHYYNERLNDHPFIQAPCKAPYSTHVYHQYTIRVRDGKRDGLQCFLRERGIPSMIYYPLPMQEQEAFRPLCRVPFPATVAADLCREVLSLPMHTEMTAEEQGYIMDTIWSYE
ncbi:MAG: DegT/DnrJ/EryC1/StrS family aminotransferase [Tannerellaceae bacterium]|nr:DegT/DnrJ/EryC1/StrS family aminotransferase [Tannerellaceae bacterium]